VGPDISARYLLRNFDAVFLAVGSLAPRDLTVPGRDLGGIHMALPFLTQQNRRNAGDRIPPQDSIAAEGKHVVVVGGGDTGADCVGTSRRQGALSVTQIELLPRPPEQRPPENPWPTWPQILRSSSSHEEGCDRFWSVMTVEFAGEGGHVSALRAVKLDWSEPDGAGRRRFVEQPGSEFTLKADLVLLAMGFLHVEHGPLVQELGLALDERGNVAADGNHMTTAGGVFAAGDCVTGASLVVRAINLGRRVAESVDAYLCALG
jgi:NADPH-dependent glutamate synthase beta subunit-like oxidoreductase